MLGLFGSLNMGARSLQVQQQGVEVAGHNLANVNNPAYARQRLNLTTELTLPTHLGPQGTGVRAVAIQQIRHELLEGQLRAEVSVGGFWTAQEQALEFGQTVLGEEIDRLANGPEGTSGAQAAGGRHGIAEGLADFFNALQNLSTDPTSTADRQSVVVKGQALAEKLNQVQGRLGQLEENLNETVREQLAQANELLSSIADYNREIVRTEATGGTANDLRDQRLQKLEELAKRVNIQTITQANGTVDVVVAGTTLVSGVDVEDTFEAYDRGDGRLQVRAATSGRALDLTGGSVQGTLAARDGALGQLRTQLDTLAATLITEVNSIHRAGFSLRGTTGADFFTGTDAASIAVHTALSMDPTLLQVSSVAGESGNNEVALALAQLADRRHASLGDQTFSQSYAFTVTALGGALAGANNQVTDQAIVEQMLRRQRDAISGVSLDEEMTDLIKFQKAYEASARLITTVDEMIETVLAMKR
jgi:flagellar hook-associated protein 1 FlgK